MGNIGAASTTTLAYRAYWHQFHATYRGKPVEKDEVPSLDPGKIKEISVMCRSNFDAQSGDFSLKMESLAAFVANKSEQTVTHL